MERYWQQMGGYRGVGVNKAIFDLSIRCYYENGNNTEHRRQMKLTDLTRWVEAYKFTHPNCTSITVKIW